LNSLTYKLRWEDPEKEQLCLEIALVLRMIHQVAMLPTELLRDVRDVRILVQDSSVGMMSPYMMLKPEMMKPAQKVTERREAEPVNKRAR
jgi:hypothetical protein